MNRRARAGMLLLAAWLVVTPPASASRGHHPPPEAPPPAVPVPVPVADQQRMTAWLFGSATDPLHRSGFCGEQIGDAFLLNAATTPVSEATCTVPAGMAVLALPAAAWAWAPTHGQTEAELIAARDSLFTGISAVTVTVDGAALDLTAAYADAGSYVIAAEPGSYLTGVTTSPDNPTGLTSALITSVGWAPRIPPLRPGPHTVELNAVFLPAARLHATYHLTVAPPAG